MQSLQRLLRLRAYGPWRVLFCLVAAAMLFRAAIPAGYMPGQDDAARTSLLVLTLCSASNAAPDITLRHGDPESDHGAAIHAACPFGASIGTAILPEPPSAFGAVWYASLPAAPPPPLLSQVSLPPTSPPLGQRAPPLLFV